MAGRAHLPADCFLTVNVNPACLASPQVDAVFADEPHLRGLVIELTEQARIESYAEVAGHLARHRERGALVAIDDAGSGYAGLAHILELRPSLIKLDRSLITGIDRDETKRALVEMLGAFAGRIDAWVLAEGIETVAELETLRDLRVPLGQGYVLGRPAAPWAGVDGVAADVLRKPDAIDEGTGATIRLLVESGPSVQKGEHEGLASRILGMEPDTYVVVVDPHHSPVAALTARGPLPGRLAPVLRVSVTTPIAEAARRALTRTAERRFEPLVCTDAAGRFLGVVRIERVIDWLAAPPRPAPP